MFDSLPCFELQMLTWSHIQQAYWHWYDHRLNLEFFDDFVKHPSRSIRNTKRSHTNNGGISSCTTQLFCINIHRGQNCPSRAILLRAPYRYSLAALVNFLNLIRCEAQCCFLCCLALTIIIHILLVFRRLRYSQICCSLSLLIWLSDGDFWSLLIIKTFFR